MDNKNGQDALKAGIWYVISSVLVKTIVFLTTPIFARIMTTEEYGIVSTFISWSSVLVPIFTINLGYSIGRAKLDFPDEVDKYISAMQVLALIVGGGIFVLAILFLSPLSNVMQMDSLYILLLLIYLIAFPIIQYTQSGCKYRYQYKQNIIIAGYITIVPVVMSLLLMICLKVDRVLLRIIGIVAPTVFLAVILWGITFKRKTLCVEKKFWKYGISLSLPLVLHAISLNLLSQSDRIFITKICGAEKTGIYSLVYTYGLILSAITNAIAEGWLPWFHDNMFCNNIKDIRKNAKVIVGLACYIVLACVALAPEAIEILGGKKYEEGISCITPIVLGVLCQTIYTHYVNIEMHLKKTKYVAFGTVGAALLNVILNVIFIPKYGYVAAAYTTLISYIALLLLHYCITRYILKVHLYQDSFMYGMLFLTCILAAMIQLSYNYTILRIIIIIIGIVSFLCIYRKYIYSYINKIHKKSVI